MTWLVSTTIKTNKRKTYFNSFRHTCLTSDQLLDIFFLNRWQLKPFVTTSGFIANKGQTTDCHNKQLEEMIYWER